MSERERRARVREDTGVIHQHSINHKSINQSMKSLFARNTAENEEERQRLSVAKQKEEYLEDTSVPMKKRALCCLFPSSSCCTCRPCEDDEADGDGEHHKSTSGTAGWLRAAVLGANDSLVSVSSIMVRGRSPIITE